MQSFVDLVLPSFQSLGVWGYWVLAFFVFFQGFAITSALSPATIFVVLAGGLAAQGVYDLGDMIWFVGISDALGSHLGYRLGGHSNAWMKDKRWYPSQATLDRSARFFERFGGMALVVGRFVPMGAFVPLVAGIVAMPEGKFTIWNFAGGFAYAAVLVLLGYFFGSTVDLVSVTMTRVGVFLVALLAALALLWFVAVRVRRLLPFLASIFGSALQAIAENPDFKALVARYPRSFRFLAARVSLARFGGLPSTLFLLVFIYFLIMFAGSTLGFVLNASVAQADIRVANLVFAFRDPRLVAFFTAITALGIWQTITVLLIGLSCLLVLMRRFYIVPVLWLVVAGNQLTVTILKLLFARPRPEMAIYVEHSYAFPSGHAAASVAFFGFLTYLAARQKAASAILSLLIGASLIFLIGLSRIYLDVHYLSDVLNGYLVGAIWAWVGIWVLEWRQIAARDIPFRKLGVTGYGVILGMVVLSGLSVAMYQPRLAQMPKDLPKKLDVSVVQAFEDRQIGHKAESLTGAYHQPISLVILAPDERSLISAFEAAGWIVAARPGLQTLPKAVFAALFGQNYVSVPVAPAFWQGKPNALAFEREGNEKNARQRHLVRIWNSGYMSKAGKMIFVATTSFDDRYKWGFTHEIDPHIDAARDLVVKTLGKTENVGGSPRVSLEDLALPGDMKKYPYFTDGQAVVIGFN